MYVVEYGGERLHDPRGGETLNAAKLDMELNASGTFEFTMQHDHPLFDKLEERRTDKPVKVYQDGELLFFGDILSIEADFYLGKKVTCRSDLAWLNDSIVRPYSTVEGEHGAAVPPTVNGYFEWLIGQHNDQVELSKQFMVGKNEGGSLAKNNYVYRANTERPTTGQELSEKLVGSLGGYLVTRGEGPKRTIDLVTDFDKINAQVIDFGVNLLDFVKTDATDDMATFVVPLGANLSDTEYDYNDGYFKTSDAKPVKGKTYYTRAYKKCGSMTEFQKGVTYYEKKQAAFVTSDTKPYSGVDYYTRKYKHTKFDGTSFKSGTTYYKKSYTYTKASGSMKYGTDYYVYNSKTGKYSKTSDTSFKSGTTYYTRTQGYVAVTVSSPQIGVTYYTREVAYTKCDGLSAFASGTTYYERETYYAATSDTTPLSGKDYYLLNRSQYSSQSDLSRFLKYPEYFEYDKGADESGQKLSLDMLGNDYISGDCWRDGDAVYSDSAVEKYGWIGAVVDFEDVTNVEELEELGLATLKGMSLPARTIEIKAVDLSMIKPDYEPIFIGQYIRARSAPHAFDSFMLCTAVSIDLMQPDQSTFTLGTTFDKLSGIQNKRINSLNRTINGVYEQAAAISAEAKAAATAANAAENAVKDAQSTAESAAENAQTAQDSAADASADAADAKAAAEDAQAAADSTLILNITTNRTATAQEGDTTITATAHVFRGGYELTADEVAEVGVVAWYLNGTMVAEGMTYSTRALDATLTAQLEAETEA